MQIEYARSRCQIGACHSPGCQVGETNILVTAAALHVQGRNGTSLAASIIPHTCKQQNMHKATLTPAEGAPRPLLQLCKP